MRILIIEDDLPLTNVLKHAFEREGHTVEVAGDGDAGAKMMNQSEYDLLLLDLTLPKLDGFEVLKQAAEGHREMRILVLSGRSRLEERVRALDEGADDFLLKPFSLLELTARARAHHSQNRIEGTYNPPSERPGAGPVTRHSAPWGQGNRTDAQRILAAGTACCQRWFSCVEDPDSE